MSTARDEIENLLYIYAERIDLGDLDGVAELFTQAEITMEGTELTRRGREEVREMYALSTRLYEDDGTPKTKHITTNAIVEVDEEQGTATSRSYFTVVQQTPALPLQVIITGRYHDRFQRENGRWRFSGRHMICDQIGDMSQHVLFDASAIPTGSGGGADS
jgi:3-phenylpropionate/cinnamic acid dioxygenase small subunit